jgi:hypothetical protein
MSITKLSPTTGNPKVRIMRRGERHWSSLQNFGRRSNRHVTTIVPGGFMTDRLRQDPLPRSSAGEIGPAQGVTNASASRLQQQRWHEEQEKEWESHLRNLQQCICGLLIKNQQLRESLNSATNRQSQELDNDYDHS